MREQGDDRVDAIREAETLADLSELLDTDSIHEAYFRAKRIWESALAEEQSGRPDPDRLPGTTVVVDGHSITVHGVTHAGTDAEQASLRTHVQRFLDRGASVYCEQGIRPMYFGNVDGVCEMDDYLWATAQREDIDDRSGFATVPEGFGTMSVDFGEVASEIRDATFALIDAGSAMYGEQFERALGDIAADFLTDHTDRAIGNSYEAFRLSRDASEDPSRLHALQQYYERTFLPQPLEREWLRRHDPELELLSHARNERMAEYVAYHNDRAEEVHLIVGAAHQHGVAYYLEQYQRDKEIPTAFELY
ncbi:hypothetical protein GRX03_15985 [Halovenus sp. WSH3]|uniref:Uncharacterized protein n=1 Tax=Halovenus carboxidivorans TaxID=2692199 RepID=A0A6B0T4A9_9EURY|nr:hypothetical protein [Halovenus carboxidivorans]MXR53098.1 hypothetical protein [Halovenus carboxidivorans]